LNKIQKRKAEEKAAEEAKGGSTKEEE
jgi:hypothetical protein